MPFSFTKSRAVRPAPSTVETNGPPSTKSLVASPYPRSAEQCNGVRLSWSTGDTSAPLLINNFIIS
ncbi:MAG: hypothetical protein L6R40_008337 [Gallowayella cf. fulva]|nr:MAG: hypothetical protein L6R40_008337 [Xanthomendoza cf. fulva]